VPEGRVNLEPRDGLLHVDVDMRGVGGQGIIFDIRAQKRSCGFLNLICLIAPGTITGTLTIEFVRIEADIQLEVVGGELVASLLNTSVDIGPTNVNIDGAFLSLFEGLFNGQIGPLIAGVESEFAGQVDTILGPLLADALGALALDTIIDFPSLAEGEENIPVRFKTGYEDVEIEPSGMTLTFAAGAHSPAEVPYTNLGSMGRAGCLDNPQRLVIPGLGGFEMVLTDDLLNQLLHGAWRGGLLEFELPPELLGDVDLSEFGVSDLVLRLSGMLQPTVSDCNEEGELLIHVGDLRIDATMQVFGEPIDVVIFASLEAGLDLRAEEGGIGLAIESVERAELEINVQQEDLVGFESVLADLIEDNLIAALLDLLGGESLGSFPLPAIDLSSAIEGINEPLLISIEPQSIDRSEGNTIVSGVLQ
jgi:hypothetical protein